MNAGLVAKGQWVFGQVKPDPVLASIGLTLNKTGGMTVQSTINSGQGSFTLGGGGRTIAFSGVTWTERGLGELHVQGDANGTLRQRMIEAEQFLRDRLSSAAGVYDLSLNDTDNEDHEMVIKSQQDGTKLIFFINGTEPWSWFTY
ncbi:uncharacterized protein ACA1_073550 [Acanthamoeba castellanii str. Neff]|uniref:Uncharacterized protein n=1 Tax=Acanthamoeba castellanii (strain ATCC 30010 / Neff) TaxID=1257118 RepID=L8HH01_ACACF|nr:uncharacterized protein ACA1_073550 [Acanthamoeba castellanii str. Neff]ELR23711.1 hypothetical protein ACA1_073550 [Acanthamoeba castellanii str. Neff]